jgi:tRNA pseudouridine55 synthase
VLLIGRATRLAQFLAGAEKEYLATIRLGFNTDTGDLTGERREGVGAADCAALKLEEIEAALVPLRGEFGQVPPMYSAKKIGGKKLYELARKGEEVERKAVPVRVSEFEIVRDADGSFSNRKEEGTCDVRARVVCSAGTYVRALAESVGENLKTGAHLAALRRTRAGEFGLDRAVSLEGLPQLVEAGRDFLVPLEVALPHIPSAHLTAEEAARVRHGAAVRAGESRGWEDGTHVALLDERGALLAVGLYDAAASTLRPRVMLAVENKC